MVIKIKIFIPTISFKTIKSNCILPEEVIMGGVSGIGSLLYFAFDIPVAVTQYALNLPKPAINGLEPTINGLEPAINSLKPAINGPKPATLITNN